MILDRFRMDGKVAVVTGASRGIGRAAAVALAEVGCDVVLCARRPKPLQRAADEVAALGRRAVAISADVTRPDALDALVARTLDEFGRVDVLVNTAGGWPPTPALRVTDAQLEEAFRMNVGQAFHLARAFAPRLAEQGGSIVNVSSAMGHLVDSGFVAYGTTKAALLHLTRLLAYEWAPRVRVNALAVGATRTDALAPFLAAGPRLEAEMVARHPLGRLGEVEDVAAAVVYLASPASAWVTGKVLEVDGGAVASTWPIPIPSGLG
jgi:7-alpha-hydroxysteroid dehydrogenase